MCHKSQHRSFHTSVTSHKLFHEAGGDKVYITCMILLPAILLDSTRCFLSSARNLACSTHYLSHTHSRLAFTCHLLTTHVSLTVNCQVGCNLYWTWLLDPHIQKAYRWKPCRLSLPNHIASWTYSEGYTVLPPLNNGEEQWRGTLFYPFLIMGKNSVGYTLLPHRTMGTNSGGYTVLPLLGEGKEQWVRGTLFFPFLMKGTNSELLVSSCCVPSVNIFN